MKYSKNNNQQKLVNIYTCPCCGPYVRIIAELWSLDEDSPFALEFINQSNGKLETVLTIKIYEPKEPCRIKRYFRCGHCDCFTGQPDFIPQSMLDDIENNITGDKAFIVPEKKDDKK